MAYFNTKPKPLAKQRPLASTHIWPKGLQQCGMRVLARCGLTFALIGLVGLSYSASALDEDRLWLPLKYRKYHFELLASAIAAQKTPACTTIVSGTIDTEHSRAGQPMFRILCRTIDGVTFNTLLDGNTREVVFAEVTERDLAPEASNQEVEELRRQQLRDELWQQCDRAMRRATKDLLEVVWLGPEQPEPAIFGDASAIWVREFDATSPRGEKLQFRAECQVAPEQKATVDLGGRVAGGG